MAVHTGSATNPEVCGVPAATGSSTVIAEQREVVSCVGSKPMATAAASNAVSRADSLTVIVAPSTPVLASRNAWRVTATNASSFP